MALAEAILVCLTEEPLTGYDLAKRFDSSVGFFWKATHQQIYRELALLKDKAWVKATTIEQEGRPNKHVFSITRQGKAHVRAWSAVPTDAASLKEGLLLKLYALQLCDIPAFVEELSSRQLAHAARLALYEKILAKRYSGRQLNRAQFGKLLGLRAGLSYELHWVQWCKETVRAIQTELPD